MRHRRMRQILEGPFLLTDEAREPRWGAGDRRRDGASLPVYPADVKWYFDGSDRAANDATGVPSRRRGARLVIHGG